MLQFQHKPHIMPFLPPKKQIPHFLGGLNYTSYSCFLFGSFPVLRPVVFPNMTRHSSAA